MFITIFNFDFLHTKCRASKTFVPRPTRDHETSVLNIKFEVPVSKTGISLLDKNDKNSYENCIANHYKDK